MYVCPQVNSTSHCHREERGVRFFGQHAQNFGKKEAFHNPCEKSTTGKSVYGLCFLTMKNSYEGEQRAI